MSAGPTPARSTPSPPAPRPLHPLGRRLLCERRVRVLAEPLLPQTGMAVAGLAVAVEELRGRGAPTQEVDERRPVGCVQECDCAVAAAGFVGTTRKASAQV